MEQNDDHRELDKIQYFTNMIVTVLIRKDPNSHSLIKDLCDHLSQSIRNPLLEIGVYLNIINTLLPFCSLSMNNIVFNNPVYYSDAFNFFRRMIISILPLNLIEELIEFTEDSEVIRVERPDIATSELVQVISQLAQCPFFLYTLSIDDFIPVDIQRKHVVTDPDTNQEKIIEDTNTYYPAQLYTLLVNALFKFILPPTSVNETILLNCSYVQNAIFLIKNLLRSGDSGVTLLTLIIIKTYNMDLVIEKNREIEFSLRNQIYQFVDNNPGLTFNLSMFKKKCHNISRGYRIYSSFKEDIIQINVLILNLELLINTADLVEIPTELILGYGLGQYYNVMQMYGYRHSLDRYAGLFNVVLGIYYHDFKYLQDSLQGQVEIEDWAGDFLNYVENEKKFEYYNSELESQQYLEYMFHFFDYKRNEQKFLLLSLLIIFCPYLLPYNLFKYSNKVSFNENYINYTENPNNTDAIQIRNFTTEGIAKMKMEDYLVGILDFMYEYGILTNIYSSGNLLFFPLYSILSNPTIYAYLHMDNLLWANELNNLYGIINNNAVNNLFKGSLMKHNLPTKNIYNVKCSFVNINAYLFSGGDYYYYNNSITKIYCPTYYILQLPDSHIYRGNYEICIYFDSSDFAFFQIQKSNRAFMNEKKMNFLKQLDDKYQELAKNLFLIAPRELLSNYYGDNLRDGDYILDYLLILIQKYVYTYEISYDLLIKYIGVQLNWNYDTHEQIMNYSIVDNLKNESLPQNMKITYEAEDNPYNKNIPSNMMITIKVSI